MIEDEPLKLASVVECEGPELSPRDIEPSSPWSVEASRWLLEDEGPAPVLEASSVESLVVASFLAIAFAFARRFWNQICIDTNRK